MAYVYRLDFEEFGLYYYGKKWDSDDCNPSDLWVSYFSSNKIVHRLREMGYIPRTYIVAYDLTQSEAGTIESGHIKKNLFDPYCLNGRGYFSHSNNTFRMSANELVSWLSTNPPYPFVDVTVSYPDPRLVAAEAKTAKQQCGRIDWLAPSRIAKVSYAVEQIKKIDARLESEEMRKKTRRIARLESEIRNKQDIILRARRDIDALKERRKKHVDFVREADEQTRIKSRKSSMR